MKVSQNPWKGSLPNSCSSSDGECSSSSSSDSSSSDSSDSENEETTAEKGLISSYAQTSNVLKYFITAVGGATTLGLAYTLGWVPCSNSHFMQNETNLWPADVKTRINQRGGYNLTCIIVAIGAAMFFSRSRILVNLVTKNCIGGDLIIFILIAVRRKIQSQIASQPFDRSFFGVNFWFHLIENVLFGLFIIACGRRWGTLCCGLTLAVETGLFLTAMVANSDSYIDSYAIINTGMMLILGACVMSFFVNPVSIVASTTIWQLMFMVGWLTFTVPAVLQDYVDEAKSPGEFDPFLPADIKKKLKLS